MSSPGEAFQAFLRLQRTEYGLALPEKIAQIVALWRANDGAPTASSLGELERLAHTLAGTAGTLGFKEVGLAAKALELALTGQDEVLPAAAQQAGIAQAVLALQASLQDK